MPMLATMAQRLSRLQKLERTSPRLVSAYAWSCWGYSLTGLWLLYCLPSMPGTCQSTVIMPTRAFALTLVLQGPCSYANDALATFGRPVPGGYTAWTWIDRAVAWFNVINLCGIIRTWPVPGPLAHWIGVAMLAIIAVTYPVSKSKEVRGMMREFLCWHIAWHYLPNILAFGFIACYVP